MKSPTALLLPTLALALAAASCHAHGESPPPASPAGAPVTPVQIEMRHLTTALANAVMGVGMGDVRAVEHDLHKVHEAKAGTEAALHAGTYRLPKNPDRLAHFVELDEAFHRNLERLAAASHANDIPGAAEVLGDLLRACQTCHGEFRR